MKTRPVVANTPLQISRPGFAVFSILLVIAFVFATFGDTGSALAANDYAYVYKVKNKSFEKDSDFNGIPNAWFTINFIPGMKRVCNQAFSGQCSFKMVGDGNPHYLYQEPAASFGSAGYTETLAGYVRGNSVVGASWLALRFAQTDGGFQYEYITLPTGTYGWTFVSDTFTADEPFNVLRIYLFMNSTSGKIWFDKITLVENL